MTNLRTEDINAATGVELDVARLATIPHGNSVLAVGTSEVVKGMPEIPKINGLPIGRFEDLDSGDYDSKTDDYLAPYKHFIDNPFFGDPPVTIPGFPGFSPKDMNAILRFASEGVDVKRTTILSVDSRRVDAGVVNLPFATREAEPVSMRSTFWIQELKEKYKGKPKLRMQYSQVVMLNFFRPREDELPGRATWPHVSINTLERVYEDDSGYTRSLDDATPRSPIMPDD